MTPTPGRTVHRPTGRAVALVLAGIVLAQLAWVTGTAWFLVVLGACAGLLVAGLTTRGRLDGVEVEVAHRRRSVVGDDVPVRVRVANRSARPSSDLVVLVQTHGLADLAVSVGALEPGTSASVTVSRPAALRRTSDVSLVHLESRPGLGLVVARRRALAVDDVVVHPRLHRVRPPRPGPAISADTDPTSDGAVVARPGPEVLGVRQWRSGDDRGRVHWRTTARTGRLTVLERGDVVQPAVRLVLLGPDPAPSFESVLTAAASTADAALRDRSRLMVVAWHVDGPVLASATTPVDLLDWWSTVHDTVLPDPAAFGSTVLRGFGPGELYVARPVETPDGWLAEAARHCPGVTLRVLDVAG
ncbi:MAG TPA: DUF58 domain-containing protein [Candidatus Nanopelagicales bacterium]|nr:DUF58 domain-containing protein [Candidatus Nanopelagicales bacterium]